jgi:hypothetical protein
MTTSPDTGGRRQLQHIREFYDAGYYGTTPGQHPIPWHGLLVGREITRMADGDVLDVACGAHVRLEHFATMVRVAKAESIYPRKQSRPAEPRFDKAHFIQALPRYCLLLKTVSMSSPAWPRLSMSSVSRRHCGTWFGFRGRASRCTATARVEGSKPR